MKKKVVDIETSRKYDLHNELDKIKLEIELLDPDAASPFLELENVGIFKMASHLPPGAVPEIVKRICDYFTELTPYDSNQIKKQIEAASADTDSNAPAGGAKKKRKERQREATVPEYYSLFNSVLGDLRRDIFSGDLMCLDKHSGKWVPAENRHRTLKSHASELSLTSNAIYRISDVDNHLDRLTHNSEPRLVVDVPEWDGVDRVSYLVKALKLKESQDHPVDIDVAEELVKHWWALAWARLEDPSIRNTILILKGPQYIGKDTWINTLTGGLGQWALNLSVSKDKDAELQLHDGMILKIAEFDKTASWESSRLKDLITKWDTHIRAPYSRRAESRMCRCSFISSCNVDDILRDHTGATRFTILEVEKIDYSYGRTAFDMAQLCAQGQAMAAKGYKASDAALKAMADYLAPRIPEDPAIEVSEMWEANIETWLDKLKSESFNRYADIKSQGWVSNSDATDAFLAVTRGSGFSIHRVRRLLATAGYHVRGNKGRGYLLTKQVRTEKSDMDEVVF